MQDLRKVNITQLQSFWNNLTVGLLILTATMVLSKLLPFYFSPIIGLLGAALLYTMLYNNKLRQSRNCMLVPYAIFYCMIVYSFMSIILNVLDIWNIVKIPKEISFFNDPYISALLLDPICFLTLIVFHLRGNKLTICVDCKLHNGITLERGKIGDIYSRESHLQLVNLIWIFGILSVIVWAYYYFNYFTSTNVNDKDWYVFLWLNVIAFALDGFYFASRYYNIYMDLKENGEIITEEELSDMTTKTYLRFYVVCGNHMYMNLTEADPSTPGKLVMDTPFKTKRNVNGITTSEVLGIIQQLAGVKGGELRFMFGRKSADLTKHRLLRYMYFLDGEPEDYADIKVKGEWIDFNMMKVIYNENPHAMSNILLSDISRVTTIILTQKLFDERGYRRIKVKSYHPTYDLKEMRKKDYDLQDDKWLKVAMFNSDTKGFHIRKFFNRLLGKKSPGQWER